MVRVPQEQGWKDLNRDAGFPHKRLPFKPQPPDWHPTFNRDANSFDRLEIRAWRVCARPHSSSAGRRQRGIRSALSRAFAKGLCIMPSTFGRDDGGSNRAHAGRFHPGVARARELSRRECILILASQVDGECNARVGEVGKATRGTGTTNGRSRNYRCDRAELESGIEDGPGERNCLLTGGCSNGVRAARDRRLSAR